MLRVGLTGGTGAGKSTVAARLAALGATVVDADALARAVLEPGTEGLAEVAAEFGPGVLRDDGALDRAALAALAFADPERRRALEAITHPRIAARTAELFAAAPAGAVVVHDVPLLVEKSMGAAYHLVVVVDAPVEARVARLVRRGMSADDARSRIAAQAGAEERRAAADVWLVNDAAPEQLQAGVDRLWHERLVPFAGNISARRRVRRPGVPTLVPHDPTWGAQAARLAARVERAAGSLGRGVEHIGSTAVPHVQAKDVLDLQLGVRTLADADALSEALAGAGYPAVPGLGDDHVHVAVDPDPAHWSKRLHGGCDPGRVVHLHVREVGGPGWRTALLMRDWWRAEAVARAAYEQEKVRLAAACATTSAYAEAKEGFFAEAVPGALRWAARTSWRPPS